MKNARFAEILLVEDNPGDVRLVQEALSENKICNNLHVAVDGIEALDFVRNGENPRPDLIILDLNLPRMNGRQVLAEIKKDESLKSIPVVVLTTSEAESDIAGSYDLHANCYITKPLDLDSFLTIVRNIQNFWFSIVELPSRS